MTARRIEIQRGEWITPAERKTRQQAADRLLLRLYATGHTQTRVNARGEDVEAPHFIRVTCLLYGPLRAFNSCPLHTITAGDVRRWNADQLATGKKTQTARAYQLLKSILTTAVADGHLSENPCQIRGESKASTGRKVEPPTDAELAIITAIVE